MSNGFASLGIRERLVQGLQESGVVEPTAIQKKAIPALLAGTDVIAQAQTGTGKTLAFVLPMLELIDVEKDYVQGLILTPTRELAIQISSELNKLAPLVGVQVLAAYGGQDVERQLKKLQKSIHIVVGTPGRLLDHLRRGSVEFYKLGMLVLDEADQMLHMGFLKEVEEIIVQTSSQRQTLLFSATMPDQVRSLAKRFMKQPAEIQIQGKQVTLEEIEQVLVQVSDREKQDALLRSIESYKPYLAMIFCRTKRRASVLNEALQESGYASDELHGDLSQAKREQVMKRFRDAKIQLLVATDMAARGLDIEGVTHVFNYDMPQDAEGYIHRIGRTGRAGETGVAVTFATPRDMFSLEQIENGIRMKLRRQGGSAGRERSDDGAYSEETGGRRKAGGRQDKGTARGAAKDRSGRAAARGAAPGRRERPAGEPGARGSFAGPGSQRSARGAGGGQRGASGSYASAGGERGTRAGADNERGGRGTRGANAGAAAERSARGSFAGGPDSERSARGAGGGQRGASGSYASASDRLTRGGGAGDKPGPNASEGRVRGGYSPYANEKRERTGRSGDFRVGADRTARGGKSGADGQQKRETDKRGRAPRGGSRGKR